MDSLPWHWIGFNLFVLCMLALDLGVFHRKHHEVSFRESMVWSLVWVALALLFNAGLTVFLGKEKGAEFLTGYVIEKSLSIDNVFVFALLFGFFRIPAMYQHRILFWGVLGALVMRAVMILVGGALMKRFEWAVYVFGAFLIVTGVRMLFQKEESSSLEGNRWIALLKRMLPLKEDYRGGSFFVRENGKLWVTPLFLTLILVEVSDLVFAVDSIPAIFAVTTDPFIVYTSNVFAILGLRSLYFALAGCMDKFHYLKTGLGVVLGFVGVKMLLAHTAWKIDTTLSLGVIVATLGFSIALSLLRPRASAPGEPSDQAKSGVPAAKPTASQPALQMD